jgi:hypothetical protein
MATYIVCTIQDPWVEISLPLVILNGMPAIMNVEDDTAGEEGMDYTGPSATLSMGVSVTCSMG